MDRGPVSVTVTKIPKGESTQEVEITTVGHIFSVIVSIDNLYTEDEIRLMASVGIFSFFHYRRPTREV